MGRHYREIAAEYRALTYAVMGRHYRETANNQALTSEEELEDLLRLKALVSAQVALRLEHREAVQEVMPWKVGEVVLFPFGDEVAQWQVRDILFTPDECLLYCESEERGVGARHWSAIHVL